MGSECCQTCEERGIAGRKSFRVVAGTPMCEACFRGEDPKTRRRTLLANVEPLSTLEHLELADFVSRWPARPRPTPCEVPYLPSMREAKEALIAKALRRTGGDRKAAALLIGISRGSLYKHPAVIRAHDHAL